MLKNKTANVITTSIILCLISLTWSCEILAQEKTKPDSENSVTQKTDSNATDAEPNRRLLIIQGAAGKPEYGNQFAEWSAKWKSAATSAGFDVVKIDSKTNKKVPAFDELQSQLKLAESLQDDLWIVMIGHGTFDGAEAKFNLPGQDFSASQLNQWLKQRKAATVIVNCASASGPFCEILKGPNRIVLASTRNGYEYNFSRFGQYLADAISGTQIDLDKDEQTSLLEAAIVANAKTAEFYKSDSRLATEHAIIEDNGDGKGTPLEWFTGVRVQKQAKDGSVTDGFLANQVFLQWDETVNTMTQEQLRARNQLERQIESIRKRKKNLTEDRYYAELEKLMLELASVYEKAAK